MTTIPELLADTAGGHRLTEGEAELLLKARGRDVWNITAAADEMRSAGRGISLRTS